MTFNTQYAKSITSYKYLDFPTLIICLSVVSYPVSLLCIHTHADLNRGIPQEVFLGKGVLKICGKFTGKNPCQSMTSIKSLGDFIKITYWHGFSPVNLLHIFKTPFPRNI